LLQFQKYFNWETSKKPIRAGAGPLDHCDPATN